MIDFLSANAELVSLLVGLFTPMLVSVVEQSTWSKRVRTGVALGTSLLVGGVTAAATGQLADPGSGFMAIAIVMAASEAAYQKVWKPAGTAGVVESATSPAGRAVAVTDKAGDF